MSKKYFLAESSYDSYYSGETTYAQMIIANSFIEGLNELKRVVSERTSIPFKEFDPAELFNFEYFFGELDGKHSECYGDIDWLENLSANEVGIYNLAEPISECVAEELPEDHFINLATEDEVNAIFLPIIKENGYPVETFSPISYSFLDYIDNVSKSEIREIKTALKKSKDLGEALKGLNVLGDNDSIDRIEKHENGATILTESGSRIKITTEA